MVRSRNRAGEVAGEVVVSTYTLASATNTLVVEAGYSGAREYYCEIEVGGDNPLGETEYAITSDKGETWIGVDGSTGSVIYWSTETVRYHTNLSAGREYEYQVKARNRANIETVLSTVYKNTTPPGRPTNLRHTSNSETSQDWDWGEVESASQYGFYISSGGGSWTDYTATTASSMSWVYGYLMANTSYSVYVTAINGNGESGPSEIEESYTGIEAPEGIEFGIIKSSVIVVKATGKMSNLEYGISGWRVEAGTGASVGEVVGDTGWQKGSSGVEIGTELRANTRYYLRGQSRNGDGDETGYTGYISTYTYAEVPGKAEARNATKNSVVVILSSETKNPVYTEYSIYNETAGKYVGSSGDLTGIAVWQTYGVWGGTQGIKNTGLSEETVYRYKVKSRNGVGIETEWSEMSEGIETLGDVMSVVGDGYGSIGLNSIEVKWRDSINPAGSKYMVETSSDMWYMNISTSSGWIRKESGKNSIVQCKRVMRTRGITAE